MRTIILAMALLGLGTVAHADPCKAIPDRGPMPFRSGAVVEGPVTYVGDGDGLCVALGDTPDRWVEIRLADFFAPELGEPGGPQAKRMLERIVMGQRLSCRIEKQSYDRAVARCMMGGRSVGDLLRKAGVEEGGNR